MAWSNNRCSISLSIFTFLYVIRVFLVIYESCLQIDVNDDVYIFCTFRNCFCIFYIYTLNFIFNDMHPCIPIPATTIDLPSTMLLMFCFLFYQPFPKSVILYSCLWSRFLALGCSGVLVIFSHFYSRAHQPLLANIVKRQVTLSTLNSC